MSSIEYWVDGGISNNGNINKSGIAYGGIGVVIIRNTKLIKKFRKSYKGSTDKLTNNRLELYAVLEALKLHLKKYSNINTIRIYSDSAYVVNSFNNQLEKWKKNDWTILTGNPVKNKDLWLKILELKIDFKIKDYYLEIIKTKGHSKNKYNNLADELATKAKEKITRKK